MSYLRCPKPDCDFAETVWGHEEPDAAMAALDSHFRARHPGDDRATLDFVREVDQP